VFNMVSCQSVGSASSANQEKPIFVVQVLSLMFLCASWMKFIKSHPVRTTQGRGVMPDGTSRFTISGKPIYHFVYFLSFLFTPAAVHTISFRWGRLLFPSILWSLTCPLSR
jgi:hypothetical protein